MKRSNLKTKIWIYLSIFSFIILIFIWFLQILSLGFYYEFSKKLEIKGIAEKISYSYKKEEYRDVLDSIAYEKDVCIEITENSNITYSTDSASRGCLVNNSKDVNDYKFRFMLSNQKSIMYKVVNPKFDNKTLIYGLKIDDGVFAFISTSLEPIGSTVNVLKKQLIIIIFVTFAISFIISFIISKKISKPIEKITKLSKEMSLGNYNIKFDTKSDINEIKELEKTLNNTVKELSKTEELRRELLANVSHDLKTPLTLIKANAEMVKDLTHSNKNKRDKNLNTIIEEVNRLNLLVEDILDLSKIQSNSIKLEKEEFNINDLIKTIIDKFNILCDKDGYKINYSGFDSIVSLDKKKLQQAIYNLINNAINYTGEDKIIYIRMIDLNDEIKIEIQDTGSGIDEEDINNIWDKYYKTDKKYKRVVYGTGLGLSIVKNIFELHNISYGVSSNKEGTVFYFVVKKSKK